MLQYDQRIRSLLSRTPRGNQANDISSSCAFLPLLDRHFDVSAHLSRLSFNSTVCGNDHNNFLILFLYLSCLFAGSQELSLNVQISYWIAIFSVTGLGVSLSDHKFPFSDCVFHMFKHWFMWSFYLFVYLFSKIVGNCKISQRVTIIYLQVNNLCYMLFKL